MATLKEENFELEVCFQQYEKPVEFKNYITTMTARISVSCYDYAGVTQFVISNEECVNFINDITKLYNSLAEGVTGISDYEPDQNNLYFKSDGFGHFTVSGVFNNWGDWTLKFEKEIDQTYFSNFIKQLNDNLKSIKK